MLALKIVLLGNNIPMYTSEYCLFYTVSVAKAETEQSDVSGLNIQMQFSKYIGTDKTDVICCNKAEKWFCFLFGRRAREASKSLVSYSQMVFLSLGDNKRLYMFEKYLKCNTCQKGLDNRDL